MMIDQLKNIEVLTKAIDNLDKAIGMNKDMVVKALIEDAKGDLVTHKDNIQAEVDAFEEWAEAESQKDRYLAGDDLSEITNFEENNPQNPLSRGGTVVQDSYDSPILAHPGAVPGEKSE